VSNPEHSKEIIERQLMNKELYRNIKTKWIKDLVFMYGSNYIQNKDVLLIIDEARREALKDVLAEIKKHTEEVMMMNPNDEDVKRELLSLEGFKQLIESKLKELSEQT
jgi:CRISPR/Cas system-associated exonuclease Cas4 (RecB family)